MENYTNEFERENSGEEIYSKVVRAGKRTYFFDVKATRGNDYFVTITESRRKILADGEVVFEKQKLHLYKEDFEKFLEGINEAMEQVKQRKPDYFEQP